MKRNYTTEQLEHIREQAFIYQCACPAQVCVVIDAMIKLYEYQQDCLTSHAGFKLNFPLSPSTLSK